MEGTLLDTRAEEKKVIRLLVSLCQALVWHCSIFEIPPVSTVLFTIVLHNCTQPEPENIWKIPKIYNLYSLNFML